MLQGLWTRHEPTTSKSSRKAFYIRALQRPTAAFHRTSTVPLTLETVDFRDHDSSRTQAGNRKVEKSKWRWCCFSPRSGVMQMREALRFVPVSSFRGIYANVEQKRLKWISHSWVIRSEWLIGHGHPYPSASSLLDDFLPVYLNWLSSSLHFFSSLFPS